MIPGYEQDADILTKRILDLIPGNLHILQLENPYDLFQIEGFKCDDLNPSLIQVNYALAKAKYLYSEIHK
jgi:hypothetical protein